MTTERTIIVLERLLHRPNGATIAELCGWMGCDERSGTPTLGIMVRAGQIHRCGFIGEKSLWALTT